MWWQKRKRMKKRRWMAKVGSRERIAKETERMREGFCSGATETRGRERKKGKGRKRKREANS